MFNDNLGFSKYKLYITLLRSGNVCANFTETKTVQSRTQTVGKQKETKRTSLYLLQNCVATILFPISIYVFAVWPSRFPSLISSQISLTFATKSVYNVFLANKHFQFRSQVFWCSENNEMPCIFPFSKFDFTRTFLDDMTRTL